jgi:hypothetical protein
VEFGICGAYSVPGAAFKFPKPLPSNARLYEKLGGGFCQAHGVVSMTYIITDFMCRCLNKFFRIDTHCVPPKHKVCHVQ